MTRRRSHDARSRPWRQRGAAMLEFTVVGPVLTLIGTLILQYALMFNAKNLANHATFMAARAGSMGNASLSTMHHAYARALIPLYGGGRDSAELVAALQKAYTDLAGNSRIEMLNPTLESFADWNDPFLEQKYGAKAIPNVGLASRSATDIKPNSGQNVQDANVLKIKVTHGYELGIPLAGTLMQFMLRWFDDGSDAFASSLYAKRRIPLVSQVTMQMLTDPVEPANPVSVAGTGNNGAPVEEPPPPDNRRSPPRCVTAGCTVIIDPNAPVGGSGGGGLGGGGLGGGGSGTGGAGGGSNGGGAGGGGAGTGTGGGPSGGSGGPGGGSGGTGNGGGGGSGSGGTGSGPPLLSCPPGDPNCTAIPQPGVCTAAKG